MATLKDLIRAETLAGGARGSAIDTSAYISFTPPAKGESVDYIAPCDGVVRVDGEYKTNDAWNSIWVFTNDTNQNGLALEGSTGWRAFCGRVKKGDKVTVGNSGETSISVTGFFKVIGGGVYKQYLSSLSRSRFGGALWLRLKTTSETLSRLAAGLPLRRQGGFLSRPLSTRVMKRGDTKPLLQSASSLSNLSTQTSVTGISKTRLPTPILAGQVSASTQGRATCPVTRAMQSRTTLGAQADKPQTQVPLRSTSFLLSVASNNARMEVAA